MDSGRIADRLRMDWNSNQTPRKIPLDSQSDPVIRNNQLLRIGLRVDSGWIPGGLGIDYG